MPNFSGMFQGFSGAPAGIESGFRMGMKYDEQKTRAQERKADLAFSLLQNPNYPETEKIKLYNNTLLPAAKEMGLELQPVTAWSSPMTKMSKDLYTAYNSGLRGDPLAKKYEELQLKYGKSDAMMARIALEKQEAKEKDHASKVLTATQILGEAIKDPGKVLSVLKENPTLQTMLTEDPQAIAEAIDKVAEVNKQRMGERQRLEKEQREDSRLALTERDKTEDKWLKNFIGSIEGTEGALGVDEEAKKNSVAEVLEDCPV